MAVSKEKGATSAVESAESGASGRAKYEAPLRPSQCRAYMRRTLAREFRGIVQGFVKEAQSGSCQHVKLATELLGRPGRLRTRRGKGTVERLLEELDTEG